MLGLTPVRELTRAGRNIIQIIYMVGIIAVLLNIIFSLRVAYSVTKPLTELTRTMSSFGKGNLSVKVPVLYMDEIGTLSEAFNKMAEKIRQLIEQVYQEQKAKRKLELAALQAQINPHFDLCSKEITLVGSWVYTLRDYATTFDFLKRAKGIGLPMADLITDKYPLEEINEALKKNLEMTGLKIAVVNK